MVASVTLVVFVFAEGLACAVLVFFVLFSPFPFCSLLLFFFFHCPVLSYPFFGFEVHMLPSMDGDLVS